MRSSQDLPPRGNDHLLVAFLTGVAACQEPVHTNADFALGDTAAISDATRVDFSRTLDPDMMVIPDLAINVPAGFFLVVARGGMSLYRKDYQNGQPDFVVIVDLQQARMRSILGPIVDPGIGGGPLGGNNPLITRQTLSNFWLQVKMQDPQAFAVVNAQFFDPARNPTALAFSVKQDGQMFTDGYGMLMEFPGQVRLFRIDNQGDRADVVAFNAGTFMQDTARFDTVIGCLDVQANKGPNNFTGRTFVGAAAGRVFMFCSSFSTQPDAAKVLNDFGAAHACMLDGGGSSQLTTEGTQNVTSARTIPHILEIAP